jgi:hypothetical protein
MEKLPISLKIPCDVSLSLSLSKKIPKKYIYVHSSVKKKKKITQHSSLRGHFLFILFFSSFFVSNREREREIVGTLAAAAIININIYRYFSEQHGKTSYFFENSL